MTDPFRDFISAISAVGRQVDPGLEHNLVWEYYADLFPRKVTSPSSARPSNIPPTKEGCLQLFIAQSGLKEGCSLKEVSEKLKSILTSQQRGVPHAFAQLLDDRYVERDLFFHAAITEGLVDEICRMFADDGDARLKIQLFRENALYLLERANSGWDKGYSEKTVRFLLLSLLAGPGNYMDLILAPEEIPLNETPADNFVDGPSDSAAPHPWALYPVYFHDRSWAIRSLTGDAYTFNPGDTVTIGREPQRNGKAITIPHIHPLTGERVSVSREHVRISCSNSNIWTIEDLNSTNGTVVTRLSTLPSDKTRIHLNQQFLQPTAAGGGEATDRGKNKATARAGDIIALAPQRAHTSANETWFYPNTESGFAFLIVDLPPKQF